VTDDEHKAQWAQVTDPIEALKVLSANSEFLGSDPYYRDLNEALWQMVNRILVNAEKH
jgi:hypothetical protein